VRSALELDVSSIVSFGIRDGAGGGGASVSVVLIDGRIVDFDFSTLESAQGEFERLHQLILREDASRQPEVDSTESLAADSDSDSLDDADGLLFSKMNPSSS